MTHAYRMIVLSCRSSFGHEHHPYFVSVWRVYYQCIVGDKKTRKVENLVKKVKNQDSENAIFEPGRFGQENLVRQVRNYYRRKMSVVNIG